MNSDKSPQNKAIFKSFTELEVWKKMRLLKIKILDLSKSFSAEEKFRLTDQIIRSSRGVNSAISEDHGRYTFPDQIHYCITARGSISETYNYLIDAFYCAYITIEKFTELRNEKDEVEKILNGYVNWLRTQLTKNK